MRVRYGITTDVFDAGGGKECVELYYLVCRNNPFEDRRERTKVDESQLPQL
jgi:hypothetical protein